MPSADSGRTEKTYAHLTILSDHLSPEMEAAVGVVPVLSWAKGDLRAHGAEPLAKEVITASGASRPSAQPGVPRHREIDFRLARKICADLEIPAPAGSR